MVKLHDAPAKHRFRRSFVDLLSAGQPRSFYIKLYGEGVDDNGGPYRVMFKKMCVDETLGYPLQLLVPPPPLAAKGGGAH